MLFDGSHWRRLALLFMVGASSSTAISSEAPPVHGQTLPVHPPVFENAENVTCRYRLHGLQKEFTGTHLSEVHYSSLPAGEYSFQVVCDAPQPRERVSRQLIRLLCQPIGFLGRVRGGGRRGWRWARLE